MKPLAPILGLLFLVIMVVQGCQSGSSTSHKNSESTGVATKKETSEPVREFIFEKAPFRSCHASTITEIPGGEFVAAWFGGSDEGNADVSIWVSRTEKGVWSKPVEVAAGEEAGGPRRPCWNPVLFQPAGKPLMLFYKVGPNPRQWWGMLKTSSDGGRTWSDAKRLPDGILGPIKNKPVMLSSGRLLCGSSTESNTDGWRIHMEWSDDLGGTWHKSEPLNDGKAIPSIQPTILVHDAKNIQILCRSKVGVAVQSSSSDNGETWSGLTPTEVMAPNSGIDAVKLKDGRSLLVFNHTADARSPLNLAMSEDNGKTWYHTAVLENEPGEYSYPAIIQAADGRVHITYTWRRERVRHVVLSPDSLKRGERIQDKNNIKK